MLFPKIFSKEKCKDILVFDISSGTIGGALVSFEKGKVPNIHYSYREVIPFNYSVTGSGLHTSMIRALNHVCKDVHDKKARKIDEAHIIISSPWVLSESKIISIENKENTLVTKKLLDHYIEQEEKKFKKIYEESVAKEEYDFDVLNVESVITDTKLNGYSVEKPYGQKAMSIEIPLFTSITSKKTVEEIKNSISKYFHIEDFQIHSFNMMSLLSLRSLPDFKNTDSSFIFINVHGEVTDVILVIDNHIHGVANIPIGTRTFLRRYAKDKNVSHHLAISEMAMNLEGTLLDAESDIGHILTKIHSEWVLEVSKNINQITASGLLPNAYYISSDLKLSGVFRKLVEDEVLDIVGIRKESVQISELSENFLAKKVGLNSEDEVLDIGIVAINNIINN